MVPAHANDSILKIHALSMVCALMFLMGVKKSTNPYVPEEVRHEVNPCWESSSQAPNMGRNI
jgi:hypothetical protein